LRNAREIGDEPFGNGDGDVAVADAIFETAEEHPVMIVGEGLHQRCRDRLLAVDRCPAGERSDRQGD
jgi:hypothetical protein